MTIPEVIGITTSTSAGVEVHDSDVSPFKWPQPEHSLP